MDKKPVFKETLCWSNVHIANANGITNEKYHFRESETV